jgi:hypothetical protein
MVMAVNSLVWRGRAIVDPTEGESAFLEAVRTTSHGRGGMAHVAQFALVLMDAEVGQLCYDCTNLPWKDPNKRVEAGEINQFDAGTSLMGRCTLRVSMSCAGGGCVVACNGRRYCRPRLLLGRDKIIKEISSAVL